MVSTLQEILASFKRRDCVPGNGNGVSDRSRSDKWQRLIDERLNEWARHPEQFEDDGLKPPAAEAMTEACKFAAYCRDRGAKPPLRVAPDGSGGIVFEWHSVPFFHVVEINARGVAEKLVFENGKLLIREPIG